MKPVPSRNVEEASAQAGAVALEESAVVVAAVDVAARTGNFLPANHAGKIKSLREPGDNSDDSKFRDGVKQAVPGLTQPIHPEGVGVRTDFWRVCKTISFAHGQILS
jgi:hypothetical protein